MENEKIITIKDFPEPIQNILCKIIFGESANPDNLAAPLSTDNQTTITEFIQSIEARRLASGRKGRRKLTHSNFSHHVRKIFSVSK